jgi:hypothetical protein
VSVKSLAQVIVSDSSVRQLRIGYRIDWLCGRAVVAAKLLENVENAEVAASLFALRDGHRLNQLDDAEIEKLVGKAVEDVSGDCEWTKAIDDILNPPAVDESQAVEAASSSEPSVVTIEQLKIRKALQRALVKAGVSTVDAIKAAKEVAPLHTIEGITEAGEKEILDAIAALEVKE